MTFSKSISFMRNFNSIKIYKFLLDFIWYSFIVLGSVLLFINIFSIAFDGVVRTGSFFHIVVQQKGLNYPKFSEILDFSIVEPSQIKLKLSHFKTSELTQPFIVLYITSLVITAVLSLFQLKLLRDFLKNILSKQIFTADNATKLSKIAYLEMATIPLTLLYTFLMVLVTKNNSVLNPSYEIVPDYVAAFEPITRSLEYFIFSGIFAFGYKLKQENDLTI